MKKIILYIFLFIALSNCGYSPILVGDIQNFNIQIQSIEGDRLINNVIVSQLNRTKNDQSENKFIINITTNYKKVINSKEATGAIASYELNAVSEFKVIKKEVSQKIIIAEKFIMDKNVNAFDEDNYERTIKQRFATTIAQKIISRLNSLK